MKHFNCGTLFKSYFRTSKSVIRNLSLVIILEACNPNVSPSLLGLYQRVYDNVLKYRYFSSWFFGKIVIRICRQNETSEIPLFKWLACSEKVIENCNVSSWNTIYNLSRSLFNNRLSVDPLKCWWSFFKCPD